MRHRARAGDDAAVVLLDPGPLGGGVVGRRGVLGVASGDDDGPSGAPTGEPRAHPALAAALRDETDIDVGFRRTGVVAVPRRRRARGMRGARRRRRAVGFAAERLSRTSSAS
jgi:hypothetical protein